MTVLEREPRELFFGSTKTTNCVCSTFVFFFFKKIRSMALGFSVRFLLLLMDLLIK